MTYLIWSILALPVFVTILILSYLLLIKKNGYIWLMPWLSHWIKTKYKSSPVEGTTHILFLFVDHFEPQNGEASKPQAISRIKKWLNQYPLIAKNHHDADGRSPQHTWFYPCEKDLSHLLYLADLPFNGFGEIELHLHHDNDNSGTLRRKLEIAKKEFMKRGACITAEQTPRQYYGFIHGNWALDNSRRDGKWCGVNDELTILKQTGCFADFTMPSAPHQTQTRKINSIYYAKDDPRKPKSHNKGTDATVGNRNRTDLLLVQGPLALSLPNGTGRWYPSIENGEIASDNPPTPKRIDQWINSQIHVKGRPNWIFIKVHTHGAPDDQHPVLLGKPLDEMFSYLESKYNDGKNYHLHYITAREAFNIIKAAEDGKEGNPGNYRDYIIPPYSNTRIKANVLHILKSYSKDRLDIINLQKSRRCVFQIKKGQLEKIEGMISMFRFRRHYKERMLELNIRGKNKIYFSVRTIKQVQTIVGGELVKSRRINRYFITNVSANLNPGMNNRIVIRW
ncbi:hypothetical protein JXJ21_11330 [candidate division KSB1 bacterium]|nr:hypothetical protein [candidate division KSB1 bacterium]